MKRHDKTRGAAAAAFAALALCGAAGAHAQTPRRTTPAKPAAPPAAPLVTADNSTMPMRNMAPAALPNSVLLFPAVITGDNGAVAAPTVSNRAIADTITEAVRQYLERGGIGVVVYSRRLPSIQRAVAEGIPPGDAANGPGDDPRKALRFAEIVGASEYLTLSVDSYAFDQKTNTVTFSLSMTRTSGDGTGLGGTAKKAIGTATMDIPGPRREVSAVASASVVVAEQTVADIYPQTSAVINPPKVEHKKTRGIKAFLVPIIAVGAAIFGSRS